MTGRSNIVPFCDNIGRVLAPRDLQRIQTEDAQRRELLIRQTLGVKGLLLFERLLGRAPFQRITNLHEAFELIDLVRADSSIHQPINSFLGMLTQAQRWAVYLNSGFHAISTHTDSHREMVQDAVRVFPDVGLSGEPAKILDIGIGNGNLAIAAAVNNLNGLVYGLDIAGAGVNISTLRLNDIVDLAQQRAKRSTDIGRFMIGRGDAADPQMFSHSKFDACSMVLAHFAIPENGRKRALTNVFNSLLPGGRLVFVDPVPRANVVDEGRNFIRLTTESAFFNNVDLTVLDVALFTVNNAQNLLQIHFQSPEEQRSHVESIGFKAISAPRPAFFGFACLQVFERP